MNPDIVSAIIAAVVSLVVVSSTILMTSKHHKGSVYKDTILDFKLDWLEKLRLHFINLVEILNTYNNEKDEAKLSEIYYKTELILNTNDERRVYLNNLSKDVINKFKKNEKDKSKALDSFVQKIRLCLEIEWLIIRCDICGYFKRKKLTQKKLVLENKLLDKNSV